MSSTGPPDPAPPLVSDLELTTVIVKTHAPRKAGEEDRVHYLVIVEGE